MNTHDSAPLPSDCAAAGERIERFEYRGLHGCACFCALEIIPLSDGQTVVIATELKDNPGTSITNVAEHLASHVCERFAIDPDRLVWIEVYGYPPPAGLRYDRTFDRVTFQRRKPQKIAWSHSILKSQPDGWPGCFEEPQWRPMSVDDWRRLGLEPRQAP